MHASEALAHSPSWYEHKTMFSSEALGTLGKASFFAKNLITG